MQLGGYYSTTYVYNGRLQDFRIYKGVAKYNGSFVVPSTSPDILPDTPSGVSGGSKLTKITDGAVSFDGTNDILSVQIVLTLLWEQVILLWRHLFITRDDIDP